MADEKVTINPSDNKLNINVSVTTKADKSNVSAPNIQNVDTLNVKSIKNLNAEEKGKKSAPNKKDKDSQNSGQLQQIIDTLAAINTTLTGIANSKEPAPADETKPKGSAVTPTTLSKSYATPGFERGLREALDKSAILKEFLQKFTESVDSLITSMETVIPNSEKADGQQTITVSSPTGEEQTKSSYSLDSVISDKARNEVVQVTSSPEPTSQTGNVELSEKLQQLTETFSVNQTANLNTETSDTTINAINAAAKEQAAEKSISVSADTTKEIGAIDKYTMAEAKASEKIDQSQISNVAIQDIKQDLKLGDSDLTKIIEETQEFFTIFKETANATEAPPADIAALTPGAGAPKEDALNKTPNSMTEMGGLSEKISRRCGPNH